MVKAKKGKMLVIGLSDKNLEKLKQDMSIKFNLKDIGFSEDIDVLIFNGKDEQKMYEMMKDSIHPYKTVIKNDRAKEN